MFAGLQCPDCGKVLPDFLPGGLCPFCTFDVILESETPASKGEDDLKIPGFELHEEVGEGGFGIVYRATQTGTMRRRVALKVLKKGVDTRQVLRRFEMERQALALLEHAHIARIYEAGKTAKGLPYFTMEYVDGQAITEALSNAPLETTLEIIIQVCGAVSHAHLKGVLHRDLKPSNILVSREGVAKVIDFGVAKALDTKRTPGLTMYTGGDGTLGTIAYMAPEQADPKVVDLDERVDIFSLGAVLYELLAGVNPHDAQGEEKSLPQPSTFSLREITPDLDRIIMRALSAKRDDRYATVGELAADLRRLLNGDRIENIASPQRRKVLYGIGLGSVALLGGAAWLGRKKDSPKIVADPPVEFRYEAQGHPFALNIHSSGTKAIALYRGNGKSIIFDPRTGEKISELKPDLFHIRFADFSLDGKELLVGYLRGAMQRYDVITGKPSMGFIETRTFNKDYPCDFTFEFEEGGEIRIATVSDHRVLAIRERSGKILRTHRTGHYRSAISPDRSRLMFGSHEGPLRLWTIGFGIRELKGHDTRFCRIAASPDGRFFASSDHQGKVGIWTIEGEHLHFIEHSSMCFGLDFSPNGEVLATGCFDGWVRIYKVKSGELIHSLNHIDQTFSLHFSPDGRLLITGGSGKQVRFWDPQSGIETFSPWQQKSTISIVRFHPRGDGDLNLIAMTSKHGVVIRSLASLRTRSSG